MGKGRECDKHILVVDGSEALVSEHTRVGYTDSNIKPTNLKIKLDNSKIKPTNVQIKLSNSKV